MIPHRDFSPVRGSFLLHQHHPALLVRFYASHLNVSAAKELPSLLIAKPSYIWKSSLGTDYCPYSRTTPTYHRKGREKLGYSSHSVRLLRFMTLRHGPRPNSPRGFVMGMILLIVLVILIVGTVPTYPYSRRWGYRPSGLLGLVLLILILMILIEWIPWGLAPGPAPTPITP